MSDKWTTVTEADQVTEEILNIAESIFDGWYADSSRIDWDDFLERMEKIPLDDDTTLDLGSDMGSPAIKKIKAHIRNYRKLG
ncbi:hypothetical protein GCM10011608_10500 [Micromonospora sonchi]|uniref:Uncharacterized protein n=1 Tax=Micromonospora sonchi TaxID=1763543 RepID=A0A917TM30_9ACTN|nr:hypothetical protein [Micromonospora sonchi]GGM27585.1 hypothetical protein GCM10011608_10500 [Micromonospora sonchi]